MVNKVAYKNYIVAFFPDTLYLLTFYV